MIKKVTIYCLFFFIVSFGFSQTQMEMNESSIKSFNIVDTELNKIYKELIKILPDEDKKLLILAQKDWLKFRNSDCKFVKNEYEGGSIQPLILYTCFEERTKTRILELKYLLKSRKERY